MKLKNHRLLIIVSFLSLYVAKSSAKSCSITHAFSTKTSYDNVANKDVAIKYPHPTCSPVQINMLHRHGHRYPSDHSIYRMKELARKINNNAEIIASRFNISLPWKCPFEKDQEMLLTPVGESDFYHTGKRIKTRFPNLFHKSYTPLVHKFQSTCRLRCVHSSNSLAAGLFENTGTLGPCKLQPIAVQTADCHHDPVLRFYDVCKKWHKAVGEDRHVWKKEYYKFKTGKVIRTLTARINHKLGFDVSSSSSSHSSHHKHLHLEDIKKLFSSCSYDLAMFNGKINSGICSLLDEEAFRIIDYLYDLSWFYSYSAGHRLNYEIACPLLADMYRSMQDARNNNTKAYSGIFRSAHQETLGPLLTLLGVYIQKGEMLTASNYDKMKDRTFRSACMTPFSGNMYFTLYRCMGNKYKIQLYVNEHLVKLPCCASDVDCDFDVFLKYYENIVKRCNLKKMCEDND